MHLGYAHLWASLLLGCLLARAPLASSPTGRVTNQFLALERLQQTTLAPLDDIWGSVLVATEEQREQGILLLASKLISDATEQSVEVFQNLLEMIREKRAVIGPRLHQRKTLRRIVRLLVWAGQEEGVDDDSIQLREKLFEYKDMVGKLLQQTRDLEVLWHEEMLKAAPERYALLQYACYVLNLQLCFFALLEELFGSPYYHHDPVALSLILKVAQASQRLLCLAAKAGALTGNLRVAQAPRVVLDLGTLPSYQADHVAALAAIPEAINAYSEAVSGLCVELRLGTPQCQTAIKTLILDVDKVSDWLAAAPQDEPSRQASAELQLRALTMWSATLVRTIMPALEAIITKCPSYYYVQYFWDTYLSRVGEEEALLPLPAAKEMLEDLILLDRQLARLPTLDQIGVALIEFHDMLRSGRRFVARSVKLISKASKTLLAVLEEIAKQSAGDTLPGEILQVHSRVLTRSLPILVCAQLMASAHPREYAEPKVPLIPLSNVKSSIKTCGRKDDDACQGSGRCDQGS